MPTENQSNTVLAPRPGKEFWDKLNALPRYMFLLKPSGNGVQKLEGFTGNWIDVHEAQKVVDQAQEEINQFRAERNALQQRLNAVDQRNDELTRQSQDDEQALIDQHQQFIDREYEDLVDQASAFQDRAYALGRVRGRLDAAGLKVKP